MTEYVSFQGFSLSISFQEILASSKIFIWAIYTKAITFVISSRLAAKARAAFMCISFSKG